MPLDLLHQLKISQLKDQDPSGSIVRMKVYHGRFFEAYKCSCKELQEDSYLFNDGIPTLILGTHRSEGFNLVVEGAEVELKSAWMCYGIITNTYWKIPENFADILVLRFEISAFLDLFDGGPQDANSSPIFNFDELLSTNAASRFYLLYQQTTIAERIVFLDEFFASLMARDYFPPVITEAIRFIEMKRGDVNVSDLLIYLGRSINMKWLHRNFIRYVGINPKKYISLQRFIYSYGDFKVNRSKDLPPNLCPCGYFDYNHFCKDFKKYIGISPSQFMKYKTN